MLFHSPAFVFGFLPVCFLGFLVVHRLWGWERALLWLFPLVYLLTRWAARRALVPLWTRVLTNIDPTRIGAGLLSQGTLAVAVAVDYALQLPERAGLVLTTAIVGTLLFDVFAQRALERYLIDAEAEGGVLSQRAWAPNGVSS